MKRTILLMIALLTILPLTTSADAMNDEQLRANSIDTALQSIVSINQSLSSMGSGFFITPNLILTNAHVVLTAGAPPITITTADGTSCTGKATYRDERSDLALVETNCAGTPLRLAHSVTTGQDAFVIGNTTPVGITVTSGIVSKVDMHSTWKFDAIITDAPATKGNSGGPIVDSDGNVIAVLKAQISDVPFLFVGIHVNEVKELLRRAGVDYEHRSESA